MDRKIIILSILSVLMLISPTVLSVANTEKTDIKKEAKILKTFVDGCNICKSTDTNKMDPPIWFPGKAIICSFLFMKYTIFSLITGKTHWDSFITANELGCSWAQDIP